METYIYEVEASTRGGAKRKLEKTMGKDGDDNEYLVDSRIVSMEETE